MRHLGEIEGNEFLTATWQAALGTAEARAYDQFVTRAGGGHFAQTRALARLATAGRPFVLRWFMARDTSGRLVGAALVLRAALGPLVLPVAKVERGPVCDRPEDLPRVLRALARTALARGIVQLRVMPYFADADAAAAARALAATGFRDVQEMDGSHAATLRVELAAGDDEATLLAAREHDKLRRELSSARKAGARARRGDAADVAVLARLEQAMMGAQGKRARGPAWYDALAQLIAADAPMGLFLAEHEGEVVSAVLVARHARLCVFVAGASLPERRPFSKMVPPLCAAMHWARAAGCREFDLGGVPELDDEDAKRAAIARFKLGFARRRVALVREHARWLAPARQGA